jgi:hypothetical protein
VYLAGARVVAAEGHRDDALVRGQAVKGGGGGLRETL